MATNGGPNIIEDGLVFAVDAANKKSYPGSGTTWTDLAGTSNGTLINGPTFDSANGGSIVFDGTNDYISTTFSYANDNDYTMGCWVKTSTSQRCGLMGIRRAFRNDDWYQSQVYITGDVNADTSGTILNFDDFNRNSNGTFSAKRKIFLNNYNIITSTWKHIVVTSDSSGARMYIDANLEGQDLNTPSPTRYEAATFNIGAAGNYPNNPLSGYYFNGQMSGVSFYNRALSSPEITQNYNALKSRFSL